jgi:hypothetical protein
MQYIRTREQALEAAADVLDLPELPDRLVQSVVRILLCLDAEARDFLVDAQALLLQDGLTGLQRRRARVLEEEADGPLGAVSTALDALRFAGVVRQVFPGLRAERWIVARALLARADLDGLLAEARPEWIDRAGALLATCRDAIGPGEPSEASSLFELAALDDAGALAVLEIAARDPAEASALLLRLRDLEESARELRLEDPSRPPDTRRVA